MPARFRRIRSWPIRSTYASWIAAEMRREEATMNNRVRDVMNSWPEVMDVEGEEDNCLYGILTDRDIVVRAIAERLDPTKTRIGDICSRKLTTVSPDHGVGHAMRVLRAKAIRRLPVAEAGQVIGVLTIGDIAVERDAGSALADISAAPPNT